MIMSALKNSLCLIVNSDELTPLLRNQLSFLGFQTTDKIHYDYVNDDYFEIATKLYSYCTKNQLRIEIEGELKSRFDQLFSNTELFMQKKRLSKDFKNGIFSNSEFDKFRLFTKTSIKRPLKDHQIKSAYHHLLLGNSADFSVPGSGKTTTLLSVYEKLYGDGVVNKLFVVGPPSCFSSWKNEFAETLSRPLNYIVLSGMSKEERINCYYDYYSNHELYLISFQTFTNDCQEIANFFQHKSSKVFFVVDEAHYMKQLDGQWAKAILNAGTYATSRHVLTGTPCPKSYSDLFNLFDLLWGKNTAISSVEKAKIVLSEKNEDYDDASNILHKTIEPLFYRVRKSDLGLTRPIYHDPIVITMNTYEKNIYDSVYKRISELSYFDSDKSILALTNLKRGRIMRLRQLTSYVKLLASAIENYEESDLFDDRDLSSVIVNYDTYELPAKIEKLLPLISQIRQADPKILIWSNFIETINLIETILMQHGFPCAHIYGDTPIISTPDNDIMSREEIIQEFLTPNSSIDILIANPAACAESISLHKNCHHAIYYDLSYNCAQYLQSLDRIHRVGGSETAFANYYFLQYADSIDNDILTNLLLKRDKMYGIIEHDADIYNLDIGVFVDAEDDLSAYDRIFSHDEV